MATKARWLLCFLMATVMLPSACISSNPGPLLRFFPSPANPRLNLSDAGEPLFLTPLLQAGKVALARKRSLVNPISLGLAESITSHAGYFTVNNRLAAHCNSNLFFWFFPAMQNPHKAPVMLWLQGGPGGSSMFGLFNEHGPFFVNKDRKTVSFRATTWSLTHHMLYIDNPVGTGFSFTDSDDCYATTEQEVASDLYDVLQQFFQLFPKLRKVDFWISGESYAGKYVPSVAYKIHTMNSEPGTTSIRLKGIAIGDGLCDPESMTDYSDFLYNIGLVDQIDREHFHNVSYIVRDLVRKKEWLKAFQVWDALLNGDETAESSYYKNVTGFNNYFNYLMTDLPEDMGYYPSFLQWPRIRRAIHVGNLTFHDGKDVEKHLITDIMQSVKPWIEALIDHNYRVLIYNGQLDVIIAWPLTDSFVRSMKWKGAVQYAQTRNQLWYVGGDLAGYVKSVDNVSVVVVRNAGHMVPYDQPRWAFDLINRFTAGKALFA